MANWLASLALLVLVVVTVQLGLAAVTGRLEESLAGRVVLRLVRRPRRRRSPAPVLPLRRPVELVSADLRRLHDAFHRGGMRFAKYEGCRQAYDGVLIEAADMMGATHLLALLPPGAELDRERARVEQLLRDHGLLPPLWAA